MTPEDITAKQGHKASGFVVGGQLMVKYLTTITTHK